ncbi:hypothetical protein C8J57DRAFT_1235138 [Mycena rebaudengoi]|nr:hypothetical protein C8J57DRAFT_1235138 [Mycena rebaudengoi]
MYAPIATAKLILRAAGARFGAGRYNCRTELGRRRLNATVQVDFESGGWMLPRSVPDSTADGYSRRTKLGRRRLNATVQVDFESSGSILPQSVPDSMAGVFNHEFPNTAIIQRAVLKYIAKPYPGYIQHRPIFPQFESKPVIHEPFNPASRRNHASSGSKYDALLNQGMPRRSSRSTWTMLGLSKVKVSTVRAKYPTAGYRALQYYINTEHAPSPATDARRHRPRRG